MTSLTSSSEFKEMSGVTPLASTVSKEASGVNPLVSSIISTKERAG